MRPAANLLMVLSAASAISFFYQAARNSAHFDPAVNFQNLLSCADTQLAQFCWKKHGQSVMLSAEPRFSPLARMVVRVCIQQAESQNLHDLHFLLGIQKCFHLGELIDLQPVYHLNDFRNSHQNSSLSWQNLSLTILLMSFFYSVLHHATLRYEKVFCYIEVIEICLKNSTKYIFGIILYFWSIFKHKQDHYVSSAEALPSVTKNHNTSLETGTLSYKVSNATCVHKEDIICGNLDPSSTPIIRNTEVMRGFSIDQANNKKIDDSITSKSFDYEINGISQPRHHDEGCCAKEKNSVKIKKDAIKLKTDVNDSLGQLLEAETFYDCKANHNGRSIQKSNHKSKDILVVGATNTHSHIKFTTGKSEKNRSAVNERAKSFGEIKDLELGKEARPCFNISTESGRAKMKAYIEAKMGHKLPLKKSVSICAKDRQLSRLDATN